MTLLRQGASFVLVGAGLIVVDWGVFVLLSALGMAAAPANVSGRVVGAVLGFLLNGHVTFGQPDAPRIGWRRFARFALLWACLTVLSTVLVTWVAAAMGLSMAWLAKPLVEGCLAVASFLLSRHWVYR